MSIAGIIGIVVVLGVIALVIYLSKYGLFFSVNISEKNMGPYLLVYKKHIGDYKNVGPVMDKLFYDLKDNHAITTTKGFGLYYDKPQEVAAEKLRSIVGCIVEGKRIEDLKDINNKYGIKEYPASKSVVAEFPYKGKVSSSLGRRMGRGAPVYSGASLNFTAPKPIIPRPWHTRNIHPHHFAGTTRMSTNLWLKSIRLKNYRCFHELSVDLDGQLIVLAGQNGTGKTAVLDAIAVSLSAFAGAFHFVEWFRFISRMHTDMRDQNIQRFGERALQMETPFQALLK